MICAALSALVLAPAGEALAAVPEPVLRASEQLDPRRIGKSSEDERAVLRVEWRAAMTGAEEAQAVQQMLDSLRRMEDTTAQIGRMVRGIPAPKSAVEATPAEAGTDIKSLAIGAAAAALLLLPLFWFTRRKTDTSPEGPARIEPPLAAPPEVAPADETAATAPAPEHSAVDMAPAIDIPLEPAPPTLIEAPMEPEVTASHNVAPSGVAISAAPAPAAKTASIEPPPDKVGTAPAPPSEIPPMEFTLEDEDPETIARANARIPVPRKPNRDTHVPERRQEVAIEPTLQLAEIMLSMGLTQGAAQTLIEYTDANPRQAVYHWLKLLAIYRDSGQRKDFEETAEKLRKFFNIQAADAAVPDPGEAPTLESFPRIADQIQKLWSQPEECQAYLRQLLEDNRDGLRIGFPQPVAEEFLLLDEILRANAGARQGDASQRSTT
jgi:hypothetical protein